MCRHIQIPWGRISGGTWSYHLGRAGGQPSRGQDGKVQAVGAAEGPPGGWAGKAAELDIIL